MKKTEAEAYTIGAGEWDEWENGDAAQEWRYLDENDSFRVTLHLDKRHGTVKLLGESLTYSGDNVYYHDVVAGRPRPCCTECYLDEFAPFALGADGEAAGILAEMFRLDEDGEIVIVGAVELPEEFVDEMRYHEERDRFYDSLAYEFVEFSNDNGLKVDDPASFEANLHAFVARNTVGGMSYGFANVDPETLAGVMHFVKELYEYDLRGYRAA